MLKLNVDKLVRIGVEGTVAPAIVYPNSVAHDGTVYSLPALGGITYNVMVGDSAFGWEGDHVEPCVSAIFNAEKRKERPNVAFNLLSCIGNEVLVIRGDAKGTKGVVCGHHGGVEHVMIDFPAKAVEKLTCDDRFQIRSFGQGLKFVDHPAISVRNIDPALLAKMGICERGGGIEVPVAAIIPGRLMGSGLGTDHPYTGDYDMMTSDPTLLRDHGLDRLKLGDIVAIADHDSTYGPRYLSGGMTIGVIIHGDSRLAGHGPGITTIISAASKVTARKDVNANIGRYLKIGRYRKGK